ncbi:hypothetical protein P3T27_003850 [Kitasatospora sp. MAA19]|uniref:DUF2563 family protein n=1 Tax=Kitasatospora sp. MAA19 TaxID=3035090 RepID=UPI0024756FDC|nr:DUF2563 family protein [Kitasatospora sp. MAA19]MDH6707121.1 hypothetical protein [Kitasatospora sp. MAA19]
MATGTGTTGGGGQGYRVEVEQLRAFAAQVRLLLAEFQHHADGTDTHGRSGVAKTSFGTFAEATEIHNRYNTMRDGLRDVLNQLQQAVDDAQKNAELTATNYEEHDQHTAKKLKLGDDGWSIANPSTSSKAAYEHTVTPPTRDGGPSAR